MRRNLDCNVEINEADGVSQITFTRAKGHYHNPGRDMQIVEIDPQSAWKIKQALMLMGAQTGSK